MIGIEYYLFGYYIYSTDPSELVDALTILMRNNIPVMQHGQGFAARAAYKKKIEELLDTRVKFTRSPLKGLGGAVVNNSKKFGMIAAVLATLVLAIISNELIWEIRVEGNEVYGENEIIDELREVGLFVGEVWSRVDFGKIESRLLADSDRVSWININRRGTVAYVKVIEKKSYEAEVMEGYSNVVATRDAIIEEISVTNGVAKVKVGDSVRAGDLLISGALPEELGGGFCYAEGIVRGRVTDSVSVFVPELTHERRVTERRLASIELKIFNYSINIFKTYRNFSISYDIIEAEKKCSFLKKELPVSFLMSYAEEYEDVLHKSTRDELASVASERLREKLLQRTSRAVLLKASTSGKYIGNGYEMKTDIVCVENIMKDVPFEYTASGKK